MYIINDVNLNNDELGAHEMFGEGKTIIRKLFLRIADEEHFSEMKRGYQGTRKCATFRHIIAIISYQSECLLL